MPKAAFTTLGCKVNQYETQRILESFEANGFEIVPFDQPADIYVVNSCSVTSIAESKSRYVVRKAARTNPDAKIVVTGCAAQMAKNKNEEFEGAHLSVPNPEKLQTLDHVLAEYPQYRGLIRLAETPKSAAGRTRATLKIQDGCNVFCSYCSIPYTRPGMHSRPANEVLDEVRKLLAMGYLEIVLTGVLIGAYGPASGSGGPDFEDLVEQIALAAAPARIRISSIEMRQVTPRLVALIQRGFVVPHLHIPLQSGDTGVLSDMNRPYTQGDYLNLCNDLYRQISSLSITTDILVGFPTETEERFQSSLHVCREAKFLKAHVFRFSPRFGTPADQWGDPVSDAEKQSRSARLNAVANETAAAHAERFVGQTMRVLVEGKSPKEGVLQGLTDNYLEVAFAGPSTDRRQFAWVRIDEAKNGKLFGERIAEPATSLRVLNS